MASQEPKQGVSLVVKLVFALPVAAVALLMLISAWPDDSPEGQAKAAARTAIAQCWKDQEGRTPEPGAPNPGAAACQAQEFDFKSRFGENP